MTAVTKFTITAMLESETMCIVRLWPQQLLQRDEDDSFTDRDFCSKIVFLWDFCGYWIHAADM